MRVQVVQIPAQTAEDVLTRLEKKIEFTRTLLVNPVDITFHIPLGVSGTENGDLSLQELRKSLSPLVRAGGVTQTGVEEHEDIQVRIKGLEVLGFVHGVEVINVGGNLHLTAQAVLDDTAEWVLGGALGQRELRVPVGHTFGADEDNVQKSLGEHVGELQPDITGQGGLCPCAQNEDSDWRGLQTQTLDIDIFTCLGRVQRVPERYKMMREY